MTSNRVSEVASAGAARSTRYTALIAVAFTYSISLFDRNLIAILQEPIARELHLSDTEIGSFGLMFAVAYAAMSFPLAAIADRGSTRSVIVVTLALWSAFTAACGAATSFWMLALARVGVAIGEAGATPASYALITARFPARTRATAMGVMLCAGVAGSNLAFGLGGRLAEAFGWRICFLIPGVLGLLSAPLVWKALGPDPAIDRDVPTTTTYAAIVEVCARFRISSSLYLIMIAFGASAFATYGMNQWIASFLIREHGFGVAAAGRALFLVGLPASAAGALSGGYIADLWTRSNPRAHALLPLIALVLATGLSLLVCFGTPIPLFAGFAGTVFVLTVIVAPIMAFVQRMMPVRLRAMAAALMVFATSLVGLGAGPLAIGFASDLLASRGVASPLRWSLLLVPCSLLAGAVAAAIAVRRVVDDMQALGAPAPEETSAQ